MLKHKRRRGFIGFFLILTLLLPSCTQVNTSIPSSSSPLPTTTNIYSEPELEYRLFDQFDVFWCDPDYYPIASPGGEQANAIAQFPAIQSNDAEFSAILNYLDLDRKTNYTDEEKLLIYRQHKKLTFAVQMTASGNVYDFSLRVGTGQGFRYEGNITLSGKITVTNQAVSFNTCPICLTKGTLIDTPIGSVPVENLCVGMTVWTLDSSGKRVAVSITRIVSTGVPENFEIVTITLQDGRWVSASPGHPSAAKKALGDYKINDMLDGSVVIGVQLHQYNGEYTFDILPGGGTGVYWANDIELLSTLE